MKTMTKFLIAMLAMMLIACGEETFVERDEVLHLPVEHGESCQYYETVYLDDLVHLPPSQRRKKGVLREGRLDCSEPNRSVVLPCNCATMDDFDRDWPNFEYSPDGYRY